MALHRRKLPPDDELFPDLTHYHSIVGALQFLTFTHPDICYSVNFVCQYMQSPTVAHFKLVKRILRYISGTSHFGMRILSSSSLDLYAFQTLIGLGAQLLAGPRLGFAPFLAVIAYHGVLRSNLPLLALVQRPSIVPWHPLLLN